MLVTLGIIYGDIGTSPLYVMSAVMGDAPLNAEIVLGKIDAVEMYPRGTKGFDSLGYNDWYRYLNSGYKVTAAGGTDKMSAGVAVGGNRTYSHLDPN